MKRVRRPLQPPRGVVEMARDPRATAIVSWGYDVHSRGEVNGLRTLPDHDFILILDGVATWECDGVEHRAPPGSLILARPGMRDDLRWDRSTRSRNFYLHFTPRRLGLPPESSWPLIRALPEGDVVRPLLAHVAWLLETRPAGWAEAAGAALEVALRAFVSGALDTTLGKRGRLPPLLERLVAHLAERWTGERLESIPLADLAVACGVSREHLCRTVQAELGCAPLAALRLVRLVRAAGMLARPDLEIGEIGRRCGFTDPYHFSRAFRAAWGVAPTVYRAALAGGRRPALRGPPGILALSRRLWEEMPLR